MGEGWGVEAAQKPQKISKGGKGLNWSAPPGSGPYAPGK